MEPFKKASEYQNYFQSMLVREHTKRKWLHKYLAEQFDRLNHLTSLISEETFWQVFPEILGIDARINLLMELAPFEEFSNEEIIRIVEKDYQNYFKELCGYDLKTKTNPSMIFTIQ